MIMLEILPLPEEVLYAISNIVFSESQFRKLIKLSIKYIERCKENGWYHNDCTCTIYTCFETPFHEDGQSNPTEFASLKNFCNTIFLYKTYHIQLIEDSFKGHRYVSIKLCSL